MQDKSVDPEIQIFISDQINVLKSSDSLQVSIGLSLS
jgi:hypothetical protein